MPDAHLAIYARIAQMLGLKGGGAAP